MVERLTVAPPLVFPLLVQHAYVAPKTRRARCSLGSSMLCKHFASAPCGERSLRSCICPTRTKGMHPAGFCSSHGLHALGAIVPAINSSPADLLCSFPQLVNCLRSYILALQFIHWPVKVRECHVPEPVLVVAKDNFGRANHLRTSRPSIRVQRSELEKNLARNPPWIALTSRTRSQSSGPPSMTCATTGAVPPRKTALASVYSSYSMTMCVTSMLRVYITPLPLSSTILGSQVYKSLFLSPLNR